MPRSWDWIAVQCAIVVTGISLVCAGWILATGSSAGIGETPTRSSGETIAGESIRLATSSEDVLVLLTAASTGSLEITTIPSDETAVDADAVRAYANANVLSLRAGCGWNCFRADYPLFRGKTVRLTVVVRRSRAPTRAELRVPARIPPAAAGLLRAVNRRMQQIRTVRATETLSNGRDTVRTEFFFRAPNRMRYRIAGGPKAVVIGRRRWDWLEGRWELSEIDAIRAPAYSWTGAGQPRLLGTTLLGGRRVRVLSLFRQADARSPIWFRLFVARDDRVLRADMFATAHFMVELFSNFDEPVVIRPPA